MPMTAFRTVTQPPYTSAKPRVFRSDSSRWVARVPYDGRVAQLFAFESWHEAMHFALLGELTQ